MTKTIRKKKGITERMIADAVGCSRQSISNWENGKGAPRGDVLKRIASYLGVKIDDIMDGGKKNDCV